MRNYIDFEAVQFIIKARFTLLALVLMSCILLACQSDRREDTSSALGAEESIEQKGIPGGYDLAIDRPAEKLSGVDAVERERKHQSAIKKQSADKDNASFEIREGEFDSFLVGNWTYDMIIRVTEDEPDMSKAGDILQIHADYTFDIWSGDDIAQTGNFTYDRNEATIRLMPVNGQSSEWKVSYLKGFAIFIGTSTFGNNAEQIKLFEGVRR